MKKICKFDPIINLQLVEIIKSNILNRQTLTVRKKELSTKLGPLTMLTGKVLTTVGKRKFSTGE